MKKFLAFVLVLSLGVCGYLFFSSSKPEDKKETKPSYTKEQILSLESLGLTKSKEYMSIQGYDNTVHPDLIKKYKDKYGLEYISDQGLAIFVAQNNLITADPSKYIGHLDFDVAKIGEKKKLLIKDWEAYNKEASEKREKNPRLRRSSEGGDFYIIGWGEPDLGTSYIVAPKEMFQMEDGDRIVDGRIVPRDPLLIYSLPEGGFVVLAKWQAMNPFRRKKKDEYPVPFGRTWWEDCKKLFKNDTGGCIDPDDPEYDAQKIYQHWIRSFMAQK